MNPAPLLDASATVQAHTAAALTAAVSGVLVLFMAKGTARHRALGYVFVATMLATALSSFWIVSLTPGRYSWIHVLSVVTVVSIALALYHRRRGNIRAHALNMIGPFVGLVIAGAFTLLPGRIMHDVFFGP